MIEKIKLIAIEAAIEAGKILKEGYGKNIKIGSKSGVNDLVTEYDIKSEKRIIEILSSEFPGCNFLCEESGKSAKTDSPIRWIIDPLDGTVNFAHKVPFFSISIAAEVDGEIVAGVVYQPMLEELFVAVRGQGAFLNGERTFVSDCEDINRSYLVTGFPYNVGENPGNCIEVFVDIVQLGIPVRRLGSAALDLAYVAGGRFDGFWEIDLNPWDVAAGILLVEEAGGKVTNFDRSPYKLGDRTILATNGLIHIKASELITTCSLERRRR